MANVAGPVVYAYTRTQAIADGVLVDVTEWASASKGFLGGFTVPVALTRRLWDAIDVDHVRPRPACQDTRGRAHDVLWIASLAVRGAFSRRERQADFAVLLQVGRQRRQFLRAVVDADGVTIGFQRDEW